MRTLVIILALTMSGCRVTASFESKPTDAPIADKTTTQKALPRPRFEQISSEGEVTDDMRLETWHDKETGQEIICVRGHYASKSCWLTGRKW